MSALRLAQLRTAVLLLVRSDELVVDAVLRWASPLVAARPAPGSDVPGRAS
jgi:hypothetical protein